MGAALSAVNAMLLTLIIITFLWSILAMHLFHNIYDDVYDGGPCIPYADGANSTVLHSEACALKPRHHFDAIGISFATTFQVRSPPTSSMIPPRRP